MSVKIRLTRLGRKKRPYYRIVAIDSRGRRDGKYIEKIGHYDPIPKPPIIEIDEEAAIKWLSRGAIPSDTVKSIFRRAAILQRWDMMKRGYEPEAIDSAVREKMQLQDAKLEKARQAAKEAAEKIEAEQKPAEEKKGEEAKEKKDEEAKEKKDEEKVVEQVEATAEPVVEVQTFMKTEAEEKAIEKKDEEKPVTEAE